MNTGAGGSFKNGFKNKKNKVNCCTYFNYKKYMYPVIFFLIEFLLHRILFQSFAILLI